MNTVKPRHRLRLAGRLLLVLLLLVLLLEIFLLRYSRWLVLMAASNGLYSLARLVLIQDPSAASIRMNRQLSPLSAACAHDDIRMVELLLSYNADPNTPEPDPMFMKKRTPLLVAIKQGNYAIVKILLEHGADVNIGIPSFHGLVVQYAVKYSRSNRDNIVLLLLEHGAEHTALDGRYFYLLHRAAAKESAEYVEALLAHGIDPMLRDENEATPLHVTTSPSVAQLLLRYHADINALDDSLRTPLFYCVRDGTAEDVAAFIRMGAQVNVVDTNGETPLHWARTAATARVLLEHGASIASKNLYGETPVETARYDAVKQVLLHYTNRDRSK